MDFTHVSSQTFCPHCGSDLVQKNGVLPKGWQRFMCNGCEKHFTINGVRNTYPEQFKNQIGEFYVIRKISARKLARRYGLSTSTVVTWGKQYKQNSHSLSL